MATSGTTTFTLNRDDIIKEALYELGVSSPKLPPSQSEISGHQKRLNSMVQSWANRATYIWKVGRVTTELLYDTAALTLTNLETITGGTVSVTTSDATITFTTAPGTSVANWTFEVAGDSVSYTVSTHTAGALTAELSAVYAGTTAAAATYTLTSDHQTSNSDAIDLEECYIRDTSTSEDGAPMTKITRRQYMALSNKDSTGTPSQYLLEYTRAGLVFTCYPVPDSYTYQLNWSAVKRMEDFTGAANEADVPAAWLNALILNLASELAPQYGIPLSERQLIMAKAADAFDSARQNSEEKGGFDIWPDLRR